jgi:hypothetical protein
VWFATSFCPALINVNERPFNGLPPSDCYVPIAVADLFDIHSDLVQDGQQYVRHRRPFLATNMLAALDSAIRMTGDKNGNAAVIVCV